MQDTAALVEVEGVRKHFAVRESLFGRARGQLRAVDAVDLRIARGEVLGVVGKSGSGKSTLGRLVLRLLEPSGGRIVFDGIELTHRTPAQIRPLRRRMQMIFQDPYASLDPRMQIGDALFEALRVTAPAPRAALRAQAAALLDQVGLPADAMQRYPRAFSGGQRQRVAIARALAVRPEFLVADEPVSALDVSIQAGIIALLQRLRTELHLAMMFISHDLSVVEMLSDRVLVLYLGRAMETGADRGGLRRLRAIRTRGRCSRRCRAATGRPGGGISRSTGEMPSPIAPPSGCVFRTRCPFAAPACRETVPMLEPVGPAHRARASAATRST